MLEVAPRVTVQELEEKEAFEVRRTMFQYYRSLRRREQAAAGKTAKVAKPYRGRDGLVVFGLGTEDRRRIVLWAREETAWKAAIVQEAVSAGGRRPPGPGPRRHGRNRSRSLA